MSKFKEPIKRYGVIESLISKRAYTTEQLSAQVPLTMGIKKISKSTIDKDIRVLREVYNAPIEYTDAGHKYTDPNFSIKQIELNPHEQRALDIAFDVLEASSNAELIQESKTILNKLFRKINSKGEPSKIISSDTNLEINGAEWFARLYKDIQEKKPIIIDYNSPRQKKVVKHQFSPYLLKEYGGMWYVIGYSDQKGFTIVMALDRIKEIRISNVNFHPDPDFDPVKYFKHSLGITHKQYHKPEKVKFWVDKDAYYYMEVRPLHGTQRVLQEKKDGFVVQLEVFLSEELLITLMGLGGRVKVLEPAELVKDIKGHLNKMKKYYK